MATYLSLLEQVKRYIHTHQLLCPDQPVVVGLSGGSDSVCLLHLLKTLNYPLVACHCNFELRGAESERDQAFVSQLCQQWHIKLHTIRFNTLDYAAANHLSVEMAARELRYNYFSQLIQQLGAQAVAVAHHRDDNIETLLLNLIRGTGIDGLAGMRPRNGEVVRPLLECTHQHILQYLSEQGLEYITDSTNLQNCCTRNKIRNQLLPLLEEINPQIRQTLSTNQTNLAIASRVYHQAIDQSLKQVLSYQNNIRKVNLSLIGKMNEAETLLYEALKGTGVHPAELGKILTMKKGARFENKRHLFEVCREGRYRILCVSPITE